MAWLTTVRLAKEFGDLTQLLPEGVRDVRDLPFPIFGALSDALLFLSWEENLPEDEQPPKSIWMDMPKLKEWFDEVKRKRKREMESGSSDAAWDQPIEDPVQNAATKDLIVE